MISEYKYPIAEIFASIQGEGMWAGTPMTFIRFAGCTVGKPYKELTRKVLGLEVYQELCRDYAGKGFPCDTNYRASLKLALGEVLKHEALQDARRVCLTGGEPMMHYLKPLVEEFVYNRKINVHIETSGTLAPDARAGLGEYFGYPSLNERVWVAVSPKRAYLPQMIERANELKILVNERTFDEGDFVTRFEPYFDKVFVQPVNNLDEISLQNALFCLSLQNKYKQLRLSIQIHKILKVR